MTDFEPAPDKGNECTDLEQRSVRALTEKMTTVPLGGDVYSVTTESGSEYRVDARQGRCICPDARHNLDDDESCKHERRVGFATGDREIPQWVNTDAVDPQLGDHVEGPSVVSEGESRTTKAIADGGTTVASHEDTDTEKDEPQATEGDNCDCNELPEGCPCWTCYRDGATFDN